MPDQTLKLIRCLKGSEIGKIWKTRYKSASCGMNLVPVTNKRNGGVDLWTSDWTQRGGCLERGGVEWRMEAAVPGGAQQREWAEHGGSAEQQERRLLLGFGQKSQRSPTSRGADMFDNSHYPFNCFNYDGDGYPSSSTDEEKKMCRPAYRYGPALHPWSLLERFSRF